jgi:hypothetical protein
LLTGLYILRGGSDRLTKLGHALTGTNRRNRHFVTALYRLQRQYAFGNWGTGWHILNRDNNLIVRMAADKR